MFTKICVFQSHISVSNPFYFNGKAPSFLVKISMAFQCNSEGTTFLSAELLTCPHSTPVCKLLEPGASLLQHFFHLSPFLASSSSSSSSSLSSSSSSSSFLQYSPSIEPKVYWSLAFSNFLLLSMLQILSWIVFVCLFLASLPQNLQWQVCQSLQNNVSYTCPDSTVSQ